jgi:histidinol-phosphatase (PHP family)
MPLKKNYHMHTELCGHAVGSIIDNVNMAESLGYEVLGFSEHAPLPLEAFNEIDNKRLYAYENMTLDIMELEYIAPLKRLQEKEKDKLKIKIGLETEYLYGYEDWYKNLYNKVEYLILGVHFFCKGDKLIDTYAEINHDTMDYYAETIENALATGMFKILAHPDLYLYDNIEFDDKAKNIADRIIDACIKYNVLVEINCNGKGRYPRPDFYEYIKNKPVKYIIGIDSHDPKRLTGDHVEYSINLAKRLGLEVVDEV